MFPKKNSGNKKKEIGVREKERTLRIDSAGLNDIIIQHFKQTQDNRNQSFRKDTSKNEPLHRITQEVINPFTAEELKQWSQIYLVGKLLGQKIYPMN